MMLVLIWIPLPFVWLVDEEQSVLVLFLPIISYISYHLLLIQQYDNPTSLSCLAIALSSCCACRSCSCSSSDDSVLKSESMIS